VARLAFQHHVPRPALELVAKVVVVIEVDSLADTKLAARHGPLDDFRLKDIVFLIEEPQVAYEPVVVAAIVLLEKQTGVEVGIERAQGRFNTELGSVS